MTSLFSSPAFVFSLLISWYLALAAPSGFAAQPTFTRDVLPILQAHCQTCHRPNGANLGGMVAPMALVTYGQVRPWAKAIARRVEAREMPPWHAAPAFHGVFRNERTLSTADIETITRWADSGAPLGRESDAPAPLVFDDVDWQIGQPDLIVSMPEPFFVEDDVADTYQTFYTTLGEDVLPADRPIRAIEFKPGSNIVHHIVSDPFGGISPGNEPKTLSDGFYMLLEKGTTVSFQMHYHKEPGPGSGVWDRSSVALKFYPDGAELVHRIRQAPIAKVDFRIPAGSPNYSERTTYTFDQDVMVLSYSPHMHVRGRYAKYEAIYRDGRREDLLEVPRYDFNWQTTYDYKEPKLLPAGTSIELSVAWDNSSANPANPDPTAEVVFGEKTTDEMMYGFVDYVFVDEPSVAAVRVSPEVLEKYVGTYRSDPEHAVTVRRDGEILKVRIHGFPEVPVRPLSETQFVFELVDAVFTFAIGENGAADTVAFTMDGKPMGVAARAPE